MPKSVPPVRHFFVDEAGDTTLFDRSGHVIVGHEGVSYTFMVGVPSMSPMARKTIVQFHAKDDLPVVRREVFRVIDELQPRKFVALRRKMKFAGFAKEQQRVFGSKIDPHAIYDELVDALIRAKSNFNRRWGTDHWKAIAVSSCVPSESAGLQVADYLLWALHRLVERREDRYCLNVASHFRLIMDLDDRRNKPYGEWYSQARPLTLETLKPALPG